MRMDPMDLENFTPHPIVLYPADTPDVINPDEHTPLATIPASGEVARLSQEESPTGTITIAGATVPVISTTFGVGAPLPAEKEGKGYIVSLPYALATPWREDLHVIQQEVRDGTGRIIGARALGRAKYATPEVLDFRVRAFGGTQSPPHLDVLMEILTQQEEGALAEKVAQNAPLDATELIRIRDAIDINRQRHNETKAARRRACEALSEIEKKMRYEKILRSAYMLGAKEWTRKYSGSTDPNPIEIMTRQMGGKVWRKIDEDGPNNATNYDYMSTEEQSAHIIEAAPRYGIPE